MMYRARALVRAVSFLGLMFGAIGCTRVPALSGFSGLLAGSEVNSAGGQSSTARTTAEALTLDQLQFKGSHNSYHQAPRMALSKGWRYSHLPLDKQLETQGVRQIELDVRYSGGQVVVGHLPIVDGRSSCRTLKKCLEQVKSWSTRHPSHLPLFVFIEPKEHVSPSNLDGRLEVLDQTIAKVFPRSALLTPRDVVGNASSLKEAVQTQGWPSLESTRGKVAFVLFGRKNHTRAYGQGRPRLEGRLMFTTGTAKDPYAVIASLDNPVAEKKEIDEALSQHMLVRTRADSDLKRDPSRREAALASGAHFIGSDFVDPKTGWLVLGERAPARCNPVFARGHTSSLPHASTSSTACVSAALSETPDEVMALVETGGAIRAKSSETAADAMVNPVTTLPGTPPAAVAVP